MPSFTEEKRKQTFFDQLRELTGEGSVTLLHKAYHNCNGDISSAINYIETNKKEFKQTSSMPDYSGRSMKKSPQILPQTPMVVENAMTRVDVPQQNPSLPQQNSSLKTSTSTTHCSNPVIDLTAAEDAELQRAIKLSMECSAAQNPPETGNSENISSGNGDADAAADSTISNSVKHLQNPYYKRRRSPEWPAGLKNVGNTCWFSSVIQSLFNLPMFCNLILQYKSPTELPPAESEQLPHQVARRSSICILTIPMQNDVHIRAVSYFMHQFLKFERHRNICFMQELKNLFALLVGSNQSYIDPTKCVSQIKTAFLRDEKHQQQDVSEFTHKLLDWLEDVMAHHPAPAPAEDEENETDRMEMDDTENSRADGEPQNNPMIDLFYGEYKARGINNGNSFTTPQKFGIFPLYINGIDNLHDSLDHSTRDRSHLDPTSDAKQEVGQEYWFTKLPPVLIFELSRFHYNQMSESPEKIHSRFDFPHLLYMDRYMESNAERTRHCREDCDNLIGQLMIMKDELKKRRKMMIGEKSFLIQDILKCCTEFAASKRERYMERKRSDCVTKRIRGVSNEPPVAINAAGDGPMDDDGDETEKKIENASVVEECLKTWLDELEQEKEGLRDDINDIQKRLDTMYDDPLLKQHPYDLHAVLIHQGFAAAGHYWAYVKDHRQSRWLKFNDTDVREASWNELIQDSIGGGQGLTSAYCLMYIDKKEKDTLMDGGHADRIIFSDKKLQEMVDKHNADYSTEIEEWEVEQAKILSLASQQRPEPEDPSTVAKEKPRTESEGSDILFSSSKSKNTSEGKRKEKNEALESWNGPDSLKAIKTAHRVYETLGAEETVDHDLTLQVSMLAIASVGNTFNMKGPDAALLQVVKEEWERLRQLEKQDSLNSDVRLQHVVVYMFRNKAPRKIIERALLEQFADDRMTYDNRATEIMKCAKDKLKAISPEDLDEDEYKKWHRDYRYFCRATYCLLQGLELWHKTEYREALPYLASVKAENDRLTETAKGEISADLLADWDLGLQTISQCLESLHIKALAQVQKDENSVDEGISILRDFIVPWIHLLPTEDSGIEIPLVERIRNDWCNLQLCGENIQEKYECALRELLDPPTTFRRPTVVKPQNPQDLCERFKKVMSTISQR